MSVHSSTSTTTLFSFPFLVAFTLFLLHFPSCHSLNNGLALTPPMGWLSWERYRCDTDCVNDPDSCISEQLYRTMADLLLDEGYSDVGYEYINIDDCWSEGSRDAQTHQLVPDKKRFPSGMPALADYVHAKGLKLGIYGDWGSYTCGGYPGTRGYEKLDADTFANWTIDSLKLDGCNTDLPSMAWGYPNVSVALNATGRHILYACSWPAYYWTYGQFNNTQWKLLMEYCNYWRNYNDVDDDWDSVTSIIDWWGDHQSTLAPIHGPGHFNDPDMIICGNFALSLYECRAQFALWAIWSAPLYLSVDLRVMDAGTKAIVTNKDIIAIDQDPLAKQGLRMKQDSCDGNMQNCKQSWWVKPLAGGDVAIVLLNKESYGMPVAMEASWVELGLKVGSSWRVKDLWMGKDLGVFNTSFTAKVNTHDANIYRFTTTVGEEKVEVAEQ